MNNFNQYVKKTIEGDPELKKEMEFELWLSEVGLNIGKLRKAKGYTQKEFAEKLGMSQSAVARIESGQNMQCSTVWTVSDVLNADLELFGVDKETERQEFETFCNYINDKEFVGSTSDLKEVEYNSRDISSFLLPNFISHATI